jgi:hypothetical protein
MDVTIDIEAAKLAEADETYGVYLNNRERQVFEMARLGMPCRRIAERLVMRVGLVRAFLRDGQPVARAIAAANKADHAATAQTRQELLAMTFEGARDLLTRPDDEVPVELKLDVMREVWDRFGAPKVTQKNATLTHTGGVAVVPMALADVLGQVATLTQARQQIVELVPGEKEEG